MINSFLSIFFGTILVLAISFLLQRAFVKSFFVKTFHKAPNNDIWRDVLDLNKGSNLKVYLKDKDYYLIGQHKAHEENGNDSWLALSSFGKLDVYSNENYKNEKSYFDDNKVTITVRFSDVEHIEIF